ncbi:MAG: epoxyqueuosine reductase QueH [Clostridia bacterium]
MKKLLLHSCCAPCSSSVLEKLTKDYEVVVFYYNPNIFPPEEYYIRQTEEINFCAQVYGDKVKVIESDYFPQDFYNIAIGLEDAPEGGERCAKCFALRLDATAKLAKELGCDLFTTTLSVSPHKNAKLLNQIGATIAQKYGVDYLVSDFKKQDGYKRSIQLSKQYSLYRQSYCGCQFSQKK